jgi:hypothetical protein
VDDDETTVWALEDELSTRRSRSRFETGRRAIIGGGHSDNLIDEVPSSDRIRALIMRDHGHPAAADEQVSPSDEDAVTPDTPDMADLCTCESVPGPAGWYPAAHLDTWVACGCLRDDDRPDKPAVSPRTLQHVDNPDEKQTLRTTQARAPRRDETADDVDRAILSQSGSQQTVASAQTDTPHQTTRQAGQVLDIATEPVGELTGRVSGNVTCYGYAVDEGICVYLNLGGPRTSVEAIRSTMNDGGIAQLTPFSDDPSLELTASSDQVDGVRKGMYETTMSNLSRARFFNAILLHETIVSPDYGGYGHTYLINPLDQAGHDREKMMHHLKMFLQIAVFDCWTDYLWQAGRDAKLIRNVRTGGGIQMWKLSLRRQAWTRIVSGGLYEDIIAIPHG